MSTRRSRFRQIISGLGSSTRLPFSTPALMITCFVLVGVVGCIDYFTGYERPLLLFYLLPISLATWFGSFLLGLGIAVVSVAILMLSHLAAGCASFFFCPVCMSLC